MATVHNVPNISQGSVATYLRCGVFRNDDYSLLEI